MGRKPAWVPVPPTINLRFSNSFVTTFLPIATTTATTSTPYDPKPQSIPVASPPFPPPSPQQLQPPNNVFARLVDSLATSLRSILPPQLPAPRRRSIPPPRSRSESGCAVPLFRPYVAKVPWHGGVRGFLSQLFPRYGHYCGPNWSSGKDGGLMLWDRRPVDWLDHCCYCHDIGYDTHDQAKLLKADLAFLDCLEKPRMATKGGSASAALVYRAMCIVGLRSILIPYRMHLIRSQSSPSFMEVFNNLINRVASSSKLVAAKRKDMLQP